ncbi:uncharacterized protein LOC116261569 [Nymphaea colorata]|nr:uncharacterized protein LOC116261569 [Nymphaea colorata]
MLSKSFEVKKAERDVARRQSRAMASPLQHRFHDCPLRLMGMSETNGMASSCRACCIPFGSGKPFYGCCRCGYFIHRPCAILSPSLEGQDPHPKHPLCLSDAPAASTDASCDICGKTVIGFRYRCQSCKFIAHPLCLQLHQTARIPGHQHLLRLSYRPGFKRSTHCDACGLQIHRACYSCSAKTCVFDLHPYCITKQRVSSERKKGYRRAKAKKVIKHATKTVTKGIIGKVLIGTIVLGVTAAFDLDCDGDGDGDGDDVDEEVDDNLDVDGDDPVGPDDVNVDMDTFYDLSACDGTDDIALQEEANMLLLSHMETMAMGEPSSSSCFP